MTADDAGHDSLSRTTTSRPGSRSGTGEVARGRRCALGFDHGRRGSYSDFSHDIVPILKARCVKCHTRGTYKGGFSLDTREPMLKSEVGRPRQERRERADRAGDERRPRLPHAPQGASGSRPTRVARVKAWIDQGLTLGAGFTFKSRATSPALKLRAARLAPGCADGRNHRRPDHRRLSRDAAPAGRPPPLDDAAFLRRGSPSTSSASCRRPESSTRSSGHRPRQARAAGPPAARRPPRLRRSLADLLERPAPQRLPGHRLHRRRPQADHAAGSISRCWRTSPTTSSSAS